MESDNNKNEMSFWEHLEELRWVLVRSALAIALGAVAAFVFSRFIFDSIIFAPMSPEFLTNRALCALALFFETPMLCLNQQPLQIININLAGQFTMHLMVSIYAGIIIAFPYIIFQLWQFVKPALRTNERYKSRKAVTTISLLFFLGVLFGYFIITPITLHFLGTYSVSSHVANTISMNSYIGSITSTTLASGIVFELPVVVLFLTQTGIITPSFLKKYRRHTFVAIMVLAAIITPPDVISLLLVVAPLWALFEVSLLVATRLYKKKIKIAEQPGS